jgi:hypothetical protein
MADRPLLLLHDEEEGHLVYSLLLLSSGQDETTLACFPRPIARFPLLPWASSFAVSGGSILGVNYNWANTRVDDAVMRVGEHKFWERLTSRPIRDALIPWLPTGLLRPINAPGSFGSHKGAPAMLPVGDGTTVIRMDTIIFDGLYSFEMLRLLPDGGGWHVTPLPKPPVGYMAQDEVEIVSAYFALGTRVWFSVTHKGTFSLDIEDGCTWRMEGTWLLPFEGRALYVAELDSVIGLTAEARLLCACDVKTGSLPTVRHVWRETFPLPSEEFILDFHNPDARPRDTPS